MREPTIQLGFSNKFAPMSKAPASDLKAAITMRLVKTEDANAFWDADFRRRYAAILLAERGA